MKGDIVDMTRRIIRTSAFRVSRTDRGDTHSILSSVPGFTVNDEELSSGARRFVVLVCMKGYDRSDATAQRDDIDLAEAMLNAARIAYRNLGPTRHDATSLQVPWLMAVNRGTGERYGQIPGRGQDEIRNQLQRISELYDIPVTELDILPLAT
jgi:hypothetical protein